MYRLLRLTSKCLAAPVILCLASASAQTNTYSTANAYTNVVPAGVGWMQIKLWGAGGGNGSSGNAGGGGAFSTFTQPVTPGDSYVIVVGQQGATSGANLGGAGSGDTEGGAPGYLGDYNSRGQGGQASSAFQLTNNLLILKAVAGAGGGSGLFASGGAGGQPGANYNTATAGQPGSGGLGGAGGGTGNPGSNYVSGATTTGILSLNLANGNGGAADNWSGGGGGGYGGGGGGGGGTNGDGAGGGGGGSFGDAIVIGNGSQPGNSSDANYLAPAGTAANNGLAVIIFAGGGPLAATNVQLSQATLRATLNPGALNTTWYFNYGTTTNYGNTTAAQVVTGGSGTVIVAQTVLNLLPGTLYHFQLVLSNSSGTLLSPDALFTTLANAYSYSSAGTYTTVAPAGTKKVTVKLWGAGGAGGAVGTGANFPGGGGAFSSVDIPAQPGDTFVVVVGQQGAFADNNLGGAGSGDTEGAPPGYLGDYGNRGQGGQASSVFQLTNGVLVMKAVAGAGGGSGVQGPGGGGGQAGADYSDATGGQPGSGGIGGSGISDNSGSNYASAAITTGISALNLAGGDGGPGANWSGGGGGGYGGGGGGGGGTGGSGAGGGGGGSYGATIVNGNGQQPGNTGDTNYIGGAGAGGNSGANGNDGLGVVLFSSVLIGTSPTLGSPALSNGVFQFSFTNTPGASFTGWATTNLANTNAWTTLGPASEISSGNFQVTDPQASNYRMRFYRVTSP